MTPAPTFPRLFPGPPAISVSKKFARVQLLPSEGLLEGTQRAEHPDYEPDLNFKRAKPESDVEQQTLI